MTATYKPTTLDNENVLCPSCNRSTGMEDGDSPYAIGSDRDEYDSPAGTRGGWTEFRGYCSLCSHEWSLVVGNHKGRLTIMVTGLGEKRYEA